MISVYSDGSSEGNSTGAIGYGWIIVNGDEILDTGHGGALVGTNNISELTGAIEGLKAFKNLGLGGPVELVSDSQYVLGIANGSFKPLKNLDLAGKIKELCDELRVTTRWVRGHNGDKYNTMCDKLAKHGKLQYSPPKITKKMERRERKKKKDAHRKSMIKAFRLQNEN